MDCYLRLADFCRVAGHRTLPAKLLMAATREWNQALAEVAIDGGELCFRGAKSRQCAGLNKARFTIHAHIYGRGPMNLTGFNEPILNPF